MHMPEQRDPVSAATLMRLEGGKRIGELGRSRRPNGIHIDIPSSTFDAAVAKTVEVLGSGAQTLYEAAFETEGLGIRVDLLQRLSTGWELAEVKSGLSYDIAKHLDDVAFQVHVAKLAGIDVRKVTLVHLNPDYIHPGGTSYDASQLFAETDITKDVLSRLATVDVDITGLRRLREIADYPVYGGTPPHHDPGIHANCKTCSFESHCKARAPEHDLYYYLSRSPKKIQQHRAAGVHDFRSVDPRDLTDLQRRWSDIVLSDTPHLSDDLGQKLATLKYPLVCIDFEAVLPGLPIWEGTRPYQTVPFQWSAQVIKERLLGGSEINPEHFSFLSTTADDPRQEFVSSLLTLLQRHQTVLHYTSYEKTVIKNLADEGITGADELLSLVDERFVDLEALVRKSFLHPGFMGKTSIKNVLPVVAPDLSYQALNIQDGDMAQARFLETLSPGISAPEREAIQKDLVDYCKLDTIAMTRLLQTLFDAAAQEK